MTQDPGYFSTSPHQYSRVPLEHASSTPSSIPDIILTGIFLISKYKIIKTYSLFAVELICFYLLPRFFQW